jgi:pyridoxamine 5'-phosphate oxidase
MKSRTTNLRREYHLDTLGEAGARANPFDQFQVWFDEATASTVPEPNAMVVATVGADGQPSQRTVLLKSFDERGFVFHTNYDSRKGVELAANPRVSLLFYWAELERQVRIGGEARHTSAEESDAYFAIRPRGSQIGSMSSPQSQVIPDRAWLARQVELLEARYPDSTPIARPDHWGGMRVEPREIEFWQGRPNRLHDRLRYRREGGAWVIDRLAP